jgi:hypothetical protein
MEGSDAIILIVHALGALVFIVSWLVGAVAMVRGAMDARATRLLRDQNFDQGPVAARKAIDVQPPALVPGVTWVGTCAIRLIHPTRAIFVFDRFAPVRGVITWSGPRAEIVVRHSRWSIVWTRAWLTGWLSAGSVGVMYAVRGSREDMLFVLPIVGIGAAFGLWMYRIRLSRAREEAEDAVDELAALLKSRRVAAGSV